MEASQLILLFVAGALGGAINTLAGGGSFIIYPALIWAGLPPVMANTTNTFACTPGYFSGAYALRNELMGQPRRLIMLTVAGLLGGAAGSCLLLAVGNSVFENFVPWLLLFASILFVSGKRLRPALARLSGQTAIMALPAFTLLMGLISFYGGFFNAGMGIILLAACAFAGLENIHESNAIKLYVSGVASLSALAIFSYYGSISWLLGLITLLGTVIGGYGSALIGKLLPQKLLLLLITLFSFGVTITFFIKTYYLP